MKVGDLVHRKIQGRKSSVFGVGIILSENTVHAGKPCYAVLWSGTLDAPSRLLRFNPARSLILAEDPLIPTSVDNTHI